MTGKVTNVDALADVEIRCANKALAGGLAAKECCRRRDIDPMIVHLMLETKSGFRVISRKQDELQQQ